MNVENTLNTKRNAGCPRNPFLELSFPSPRVSTDIKRQCMNSAKDATSYSTKMGSRWASSARKLGI